MIYAAPTLQILNRLSRNVLKTWSTVLSNYTYLVIQTTTRTLFRKFEVVLHFFCPRSVLPNEYIAFF